MQGIAYAMLNAKVGGTMADSAKRILMVEDDAIIGMDMKDTVEQMGYDVVDIIDRGEDVVPAVKKLNPDGLLMDINLKGFMSGWDAAALVRGVSTIPIILMTGHKDETTSNRIAAIPGTSLLAKPVDYELLHSKFREVFK
jgi:DNA-binding response OmpR family regulator